MSKFNKSQKIAILLFVIIIIFMMVSYSNGKNHKLPAEAKVEIEAPLVKVELITSQPKTQYLELYGVTKSNRKVIIQSEANGKVESILAKEGSLISKGDIIIKLDVRDKIHLLKQAETVIKEKKVILNAAEKLKKSGYTSNFEYLNAKSEYNNALAIFEQARIDLDNTEVKAPFDGLLEKIHVNAGDLLGANSFNSANGNGVATIIDYNPLLVIVNISEKFINQLAVKDKANVIIDNKQYEANISYISSIADPITRTFEVELEIYDQNIFVEGKTAKIKLPVGEALSHLIPHSAITLNSEGKIGIKILDDFDIVKFYEIEILSEDEFGLWVKNIPNNSRLITLGQDFVKNGSKARADDIK